MGHAAEPNPQLDTTVLETWRAVTIRCGYDPEGTEACGATLRPPPAHHAPASAPAPAPPPDPNSVASSDASVRVTRTQPAWTASPAGAGRGKSFHSWAAISTAHMPAASIAQVNA